LLATEPKIRDSEAVRQRMFAAKTPTIPVSEIRFPVSDLARTAIPQTSIASNSAA